MLMHGERFARRSEDLPGDNDPHEPVSQDVSTMRPRLCLALRTHSPFTMSKIIRQTAAHLKLACPPGAAAASKALEVWWSLSGSNR